MSCQTAISINDVNGINYAFSANDDGTLVATATLLTNMPDLFLQDAMVRRWKLFLNASGQLVSLLVDVVPAPQQVLLISQSNLDYFLQITTDGLIQLFGGNPPNVVLVGQIFKPDDAYPTFAQPGGIGTPTFPQQQVGELIGMWFAGCGHSFNHWMILCISLGCGQSALIECPICSYIQRIITPYSLIQDNEANYIIVA